MQSITVWKEAEAPNYSTQANLLFPYSEVPYLGEYNLLKIPASLNHLIQHVDYWGEGRIVTEQGVLGFSNCYNVNQEFQLVSNGSDVDRKIPNRIPVPDYNNCDTSAYIKNNSVLTVTVAGPHIECSAIDIARIVNKDHGKVVAYGVNNARDIPELTAELRLKDLYPCPGATLSSELEGLTYYDSYVPFVDIKQIKDELYKNIVNANYANAAAMATGLGEASDEGVISEIVRRAISTAPRNVMSFAYQLWHGGQKDIVRNHFPKPFQHILNEDAVTIINKEYRQPLKLDVNTDSYNDRLAWGDNDQCELTSERVSWKFLPVWDRNVVTFKVFNTHRSMYLKLDVNEDNIGDRKVWGSTNSGEDRHRYYLEPMFINDTILFYIVNYKYGQALKLAVNVDNIGDRLLWGHNGTYTEYERFRWIIAAW